MTRPLTLRLALGLTALPLLVSAATAEVVVTGDRATWHPLTLALRGPDTSETTTPGMSWSASFIR